eukprot:Tbor_TRINITY_DN5680_c0_g2::TRINITY_DN5680_c0_g2_i1::g.9023::m.9023/K04371/MAPK1_3; mitogen-activated protein kinase 1/3
MPSVKGEAAMALVISELEAMSAKYTVDKYISSGSYGAVCAGKDASGTPVAIKRVYTTVSDGKTVTIMSDSFLGKRVLREVKLLSHFHHKNILGLRNVMVCMTPPCHEKLYLVTELLRTDLAQVVADSSIKISQDHIKYFMYHILLGLHCLHEAGVVHRDLHPGNILLADNNDVKICDFNLAREDTPGDDKTHYVTHRWYRAPELVMQFKSFTKKVDIWSAGCIMAELFNRKALFRGSTFYNQLNKIVEVVGTPQENEVAMFSSQSARDYLKTTLNNCPQRPWAQVCPEAGEDAIDLLSKLLAFNPNTRITADEALRHPYFAQYFDEEELHEEHAEPFHFDEQINSISDMHKMFLEVAEKFAASPKTEPEETDDNPVAGESGMGLGANHMPRSGSFLSLDLVDQ